MPHPKRIRQKLDAELALQLRKGRAAKAAAVLAEIVDKDRDDDRLFVRLAELRLKIGDEAGARAAYQGAAEAAEKKGFYLRAMAALRQQARTLAPAERPWLELARLAMRLGLVADSVGFLDEGVRAWEHVGDRPRVIQALRRIHDLAPDDVRRALKLAHELRAAGFVADAVALLREDAERHRQAGREEAWLSVGRDLALLAPSVQLNLQMARALLAREEPRGALKVLRPYLDGKERDAEAVALAAKALADLAKPVRPAAPVAPPVLVATPVPGTLPAVAPPPELQLTGPYEPIVPEEPPAPRPAPPVLRPVRPTPPPFALAPPAPVAAVPAPVDPPAAELLPLAAPFEPTAPPEPAPGAALPPLEEAEPLHVPIEVTGSALIPMLPADLPPAAAAQPLLELTGSAILPPLQAPPDEPLEVTGSSILPAEPAPEPVEVTGSALIPVLERVAAPAVGEADDEEELVDLSGDGVEVEQEEDAPAPDPDPDHEVVDLATAALSVEDEPFILPEDVADELAHVAFLVAHGFDDEARELLDVVDAHHPGHPGVEELRVRMAAGRDRRAPRAAPGQPVPDLAIEQLEGVAFVSAEAVLESFKQGVASAVPAGDWATRYDLGIAYREMGLWSDALAEFETALMAAPGHRTVDCLLGVAQCHAGRGHHVEAARALERALGVQPLTAATAAAVTYELGLVRLARGDGAAAARAFEASDRAVPGFRDARAQAARLRVEDGGGEPEGGPLPDAAGA